MLLGIHCCSIDNSIISQSYHQSSLARCGKVSRIERIIWRPTDWVCLFLCREYFSSSKEVLLDSAIIFSPNLQNLGNYVQQSGDKMKINAALLRGLQRPRNRPKVHFSPSLRSEWKDRRRRRRRMNRIRSMAKNGNKGSGEKLDEYSGSLYKPLPLLTRWKWNGTGH